MTQDSRAHNLSLLVLFAFLLTLGALFQDYRFDRALNGERSTLRSVEQQIGLIAVAHAEFRAAETGYLAVGQGPDFWTRRASELYAQIATALTRLRSSSAPSVTPQYEAAIAALADLENIDKRARELIENDQRFMAADLVFVDANEPSQRLAGALGSARSAEIVMAEARMTFTSRIRFALNAGAMGLVLLVALVLGRPAKHISNLSDAERMAQMLRELPPAVKPAIPLSRATPPPAPVVVAPPAPPFSLADTAELCVDLARVIDSRDVPALLERAAALLDAKGLIIWMVDRQSNSLTPSVTHGYPDKVLIRMGSLDVGADNVTSLAFQSMRPQTMPATAPGGAGAIAVPLITSSGCSGVLAAEVRDGKPSEEMVALAKIIAAQFATLIGPGDVSPARAAQA